MGASAVLKSDWKLTLCWRTGQAGLGLSREDRTERTGQGALDREDQARKTGQGGQGTEVTS